MVLLTILTQKNGETVYFDKTIPKVHCMTLISCSLYNSWHNLKNEGSLSIVESDESVKVSKIPPGHYTLEIMAKQMEESLKKYFYEISADTYSPPGQVVITNHGKKPLRIDRDLANFLAISRELKKDKLIVQQIIKQTAYFIHCDLIDRDQNYLNNKRSDLLAKIDVKGKPYEKVRYDASPQQPFRDCSTSSHVNSVTVRDEDGELFDFNDLPIEFELEIN